MTRLWHYVQNGKANGPVPEEQLRGLLASGTLRPSDLVWHEGMAAWTAIQTLPELAAPSSSPALPQPSTIQLDEPASSAVSSEAIDALRKTKPWVRLMGVLGAIAMVALLGGCVAVVLLKVGFLRYMGLPARIGMAAGYGVMALLYLPPVLYLNRYASRIGDLMKDGTMASLERALRAQKSLWKYVGIFTVVVLCLNVLALIGVVVTSVALSMGKLF